jgi:hypothetical protein
MESYRALFELPATSSCFSRPVTLGDVLSGDVFSDELWPSWWRVVPLPLVDHWSELSEETRYVAFVIAVEACEELIDTPNGL